jgi:hypothetical protein
MRHEKFLNFLLGIRLFIFGVCETLVFSAFVIALAIYMLADIGIFVRHIL